MHPLPRQFAAAGPPPQGKRNLNLRPEKPQEAVVVPGGLQAFSVDTDFDSFVLLVQAQSNTVSLAHDMSGGISK